MHSFFMRIGSGFVFLLVSATWLYSDFTITATKSQINTFLGNKPAKIVFSEAIFNPVTEKIDKKKLYLIDLSQATLTAQEINTPIDLPDQPAFSPNGSYIAYSDNNDGGGGTGGKGFIYKLAGASTQPIPGASVAVPRWWVDPWSTAKDTNIIFTTEVQNHTIYYCSEAHLDPNNRLYRAECAGKQVGDERFNPFNLDIFVKKIKMTAGNLEDTATSIARGPFEGGLTRDGKYLGSGQGPGFYIRDNVFNTRARLFDSLHNGVLGITMQICNPSVSPSVTLPQEYMILDFGSNEVSSIVGRAYAQHEVIFIVNQSNIVTKWIAAPDLGYQMDFPEWSTHPDYAITNYQSAQGTKKDLVLIDIKNSEFLKIGSSSETVSGSHLWVEYTGNATPVTATSPFTTPVLDPAVVGVRGQYFSEDLRSINVPGMAKTVEVPVGDILNISVFDLMGSRLISQGEAHAKTDYLRKGIYFMAVSYKNRAEFVKKIVNLQ